MGDLIKLTKTETELLDGILSGHNVAIEISIPNDLAPKKAVSWSKAAASLLDKKDGEVAVILHCMARLHFLARTNPKILKEADCATLDEFEEKILKCKQHRSTIWKLSSGYKTFGALVTPDDVAAIGTENLQRATQMAKKVGASPAQKEVILEKAKELSVDGFKEWGEKDSGLSAPGETTNASFKCGGTLAQVREVESLLKEPRFAQFAGSSKPIEMILAAIQASSAEWPAEEIQAGHEPAAIAAEETMDQW